MSLTKTDSESYITLVVSVVPKNLNYHHKDGNFWTETNKEAIPYLMNTAFHEWVDRKPMDSLDDE